MLFFFNDTATTEIYTLSLHDALPISRAVDDAREDVAAKLVGAEHMRLGRRQELVRDDHLDRVVRRNQRGKDRRSEEHTSELQSRQYLVCRLLLEKKNIFVLPLPSLLF